MLRKGNVFTPVCQSFCSQGGVSQHALGQTPPWQTVHLLGRHLPLQTPPLADTPQCIPACIGADTAPMAVRILLECILVRNVSGQLLDGNCCLPTTKC